MKINEISSKLQSQLDQMADPHKASREHSQSMSDKTKKDIQDYKDKRYGTKDEQKAKAKQAAKDQPKSKGMSSAGWKAAHDDIMDKRMQRHRDAK